MTWEYALILILILLIFSAFGIMFFIQKRNVKNETKDYDFKSISRKKKAENIETVLLNEYINFIEKVQNLLKEFDPITGKNTMKEINEFAKKGLLEISSFNNIKSIKNIKNSKINWKLIEKLELTKASNWKKFNKEIEIMILKK